eukprot:gene7501-10219_t
MSSATLVKHGLKSLPKKCLGQSFLCANISHSAKISTFNNGSCFCPLCNSVDKYCNIKSRSITFRSSTMKDDQVASPVSELLSNNKNWIKSMEIADPDYFKKLSAVKHPKYLYIGCSDSRVPANQVLGLPPGDVFVHRNIGNLVPGNDLNVLSVLEYAISHVGVTDIIVAGHYDCGAIKAASSRQDLGTLENWLRSIRDVHRLHKDFLDNISDPDDRHASLVELNVIEQCLNVYKTGVVQRSRLKSKDSTGENKTSKTVFGIPRIHGMVFNPADGFLRRLNVDFKRRIGSLDHIYGLY